ASGARIELVDHNFRPGDLELVKITKDGFIYENKRTMPRAMFAHSWRLANFETIIETGAWPEFDPRATILLESDPAGAHPYAPAPSDSPNVASAAMIHNPGERNEQADAHVVI